MVKRVAEIAVAVLFAAACLLALLFPLFRTFSAGGEKYLCRWEDGSETMESYASAYGSFSEISEDGIALFRNGTRGSVAGGEEFLRAASVLRNGELAELLALRVGVSELTRLERAALGLTYGDLLYYSGEFFGFTGETVVRTERTKAKTVVLLSGGIGADVLAASGADKLEVGKEAEFSPLSLVGTSVSSFEARAPYFAADGALYLDSPDRRFIAAVPCAEEFAVGDARFLDEFSLVACEKLVSLELPFLGNTPHPEAEGYVGELGFLFGRNEEGAYMIPETFKKLKVRSGPVTGQAFYRCFSLEEVDLCGISGWDIEREAFRGLPALKRLHTRSFADLGAEFTYRKLSCGCYLFERSEG